MAFSRKKSKCVLGSTPPPTKVVSIERGKVRVESKGEGRRRATLSRIEEGTLLG